MSEFDATARPRRLGDTEDEVRDLLTGAGPRPGVPAEDLAAIRVAARSEWQRLVHGERHRSARRRLWGGLALAASLLLAAGIAWVWSARSGPAIAERIASVERLAGRVVAVGPGDSGAPADLAAGAEILPGTALETLAGDAGEPSRIALRLRGGPSVRLDRGTRVRLVSERRLELERGAVYLDTGSVPGGSAAGAARAPDPLEVATPFGVVRDIGTRFEVRLGGDEMPLRVRVRDGQVSLESGRSSYSAAGGEQLSLDAGGAVHKSEAPRYGSEWNWVLEAAPDFDIEGETLRAFLDWVAGETGWVVQYSDSAVADSAAVIRLHGTIEGLAPNESVDVVLLGSGLGYRLENGTLLVERAVPH